MGSVAIAAVVSFRVEEMGYMAYGRLKWAFPRRMQAGLINAANVLKRYWKASAQLQNG